MAINPFRTDELQKPSPARLSLDASASPSRHMSTNQDNESDDELAQFANDQQHSKTARDTSPAEANTRQSSSAGSVSGSASPATGQQVNTLRSPFTSPKPLPQSPFLPKSSTSTILPNQRPTSLSLSSSASLQANPFNRISTSTNKPENSYLKRRETHAFREEEPLPDLYGPEPEHSRHRKKKEPHQLRNRIAVLWLKPTTLPAPSLAEFKIVSEGKKAKGELGGRKEFPSGIAYGTRKLANEKGIPLLTTTQTPPEHAFLEFSSLLTTAKAESQQNIFLYMCPAPNNDGSALFTALKELFLLKNPSIAMPIIDFLLWLCRCSVPRSLHLLNSGFLSDIFSVMKPKPQAKVGIGVHLSLIQLIETAVLIETDRDLLPDAVNAQLGGDSLQGRLLSGVLQPAHPYLLHVAGNHVRSPHLLSFALAFRPALPLVASLNLPLILISWLCEMVSEGQFCWRLIRIMKVLNRVTDRDHNSTTARGAQHGYIGHNELTVKETVHAFQKMFHVNPKVR
ncbi:hypothetical protein BLNAU_12563 [Blattamonas nauphoetae]|uniref:Uncharacterized protein n=1 Tax=Blattamonas nauphoetae TaxID=2049346 RepID=A0ABQ9XM34_9EUKA|nr:hypothetical protein BLNAU_12563 [Blattamonas nauphoetae]